MQEKLFTSFELGSIVLSSRVVMAPLTRCRAINNNTPNSIMAVYYKQRASAGLIIAEGTSPSPNGLGYRNIPGLFTKHHVEAWKLTTNAVRKADGHIFIQLMHTGRVGHPNNLPEGAKVIGPSPIAQPGEVSTYKAGKQPYPIPEEMTLKDINDTIDEFVYSSKLAIEAGFHGVEIHCAHGYLPNQFINESSNQRKDKYGGSIENRCRFTLDVLKATCKAIGSNKVGIRVSPFSYADTNENKELIDKTYMYLTSELNKLNLAYLHLSHMGEPTPNKFKLFKTIRTMYNGVLIKCGDFNKATANEALINNECDLVAFGRDYIANPDLVERFKNNWPLTERNNEQWYGNGKKGYTDYSFY